MTCYRINIIAYWHYGLKTSVYVFFFSWVVMKRSTHSPWLHATAEYVAQKQYGTKRPAVWGRTKSRWRTSRTTIASRSGGPKPSCARRTSPRPSGPSRPCHAFPAERFMARQSDYNIAVRMEQNKYPSKTENRPIHATRFTQVDPKK